MTRIAAIDYGRVRIGIAISDERAILARPVACLYTAETLVGTAQVIWATLASYSPLMTIVLGLPLHCSGKESAMSQEVRDLAHTLNSLANVPITLWDERLTTAQVEKDLRTREVRRKKRRHLLDMCSATLILQSYLNSFPAHTER